jgi:acetoin utilization protein AcuC
MSRTAFLCSPGLWLSGHGPSHPLKPERLRRTYELLTAYGAFEPKDSLLVEPRPATLEELCRFHTPEYVDVVKRLSTGEKVPHSGRYGFGPGDNPVFAHMWETESLKAGAAIVAAEMLLSGEVETAFSFAGGMHHADPARASGFCVFNDPAIAIHYLVDQGLRVAYVDVDAHHGDGVQRAFYDTDRVLTISLHESGHYLFPGTGFTDEQGAGAGQGTCVNIPLPPYTTDGLYVKAFKEVVVPVVERYRPDIIVTQLGVDTHYLDPLTHLRLSTWGYQVVVGMMKGLAPLWLTLGGGGYDISVVPRAWSLAYGIMSEQKFADELPLAYAEKYGAGTLRDDQLPELDPRTIDQVEMQLNRRVEELREALHF